MRPWSLLQCNMTISTLLANPALDTCTHCGPIFFNCVTVQPNNYYQRRHDFMQAIRHFSCWQGPVSPYRFFFTYFFLYQYRSVEIAELVDETKRTELNVYFRYLALTQLGHPERNWQPIISRQKNVARGINLAVEVCIMSMYSISLSHVLHINN